MKTLEQLQQGPASFSLGTALSDGWKLVSSSMLYYILGGIITIVISIACGFIPILGAIANGLILSPCLTAGAVYVTWRISNKQGWTDFGDMFKGFNYLSPLLVSTLIQLLLMMAIGGAILISYIPDIIHLVRLTQGGGSFTHQEEIKEIIFSFFAMKTILIFIGVFLIYLFITLIWAFKNHFIVIYNLQAWPAMEMSRKLAMRNFIELLALFIVMGLIIIVSALPCGLGLLFTLPWMIGATYSAFAQMTGSDQAYDLHQQGFDFMKEENA